MNLRQLSNIVAIADAESVSAAAERLFLSRPALNRCLLNIEREIGTPLFKRIHKRLIPTQAGKMYIDASRNSGLLEIMRPRRVRSQVVFELS
jgi:DNA-binding transcriptional LysR family regulator